MRSDGGMLWYLLNKIRGGGASNDRGNTPAFGFDGTDDYISSNATIGRTGYDMQVSGNVSTGSDTDGSYFWINGNRDATIPTGTNAEIQTTTNPTINQTTSFTISAKFKFNGVVPTGGSMGIFGRSNIISLYADNSAGTNLAKFRIRNGGTFTDVTFTATVSTVYTIHGVYDTSINKMYLYVNGALQNVGGTTVAAATFGGTQNFILGDGGLGGGNVKSLSTYIYHAAIRNKALTQAEIDADIALGNTAKNDPSIVAYYIPDNLQFNTQYGLNPKALDQSNWIKTGATTVTADTTVAPDGTTTADTLAISGTASQGCTTVVTSISGSTIASKTFIVKAFVKVAAGTSLFRLECSHNGVATYNSSDQTATTTRQEFTFTKTFTSATGGTGITYGIDNSSGATNPTLQVRNVRLFLVNETLRDESPNIGGFIGWKTQQALSCRVKPNADSTNSANAFTLMLPSYIYVHIRDTNNAINFRYDSTRVPSGSVAAGYILGNGFRSKVHITAVLGFSAGVRTLKLYVGGVLRSTVAITNQPPTTNYNTLFWMGRKGTNYFSGNIRDPRIYTFTGSFTDADALAIYNGGEPTSSGVTKYLQYKPLSGEIGTTTSDLSGNLRDGTLNGGVTRVVV